MAALRLCNGLAFTKGSPEEISMQRKIQSWLEKNILEEERHRIEKIYPRDWYDQ